MALDAAQEARWTAERAACWARFCAAVAAAHAGSYGLGNALINHVRVLFGDAAAECARAELRGCVARWPKP
jgi:hypothetical protein